MRIVEAIYRAHLEALAAYGDQRAWFRLCAYRRLDRWRLWCEIQRDLEVAETFGMRSEMVDFWRLRMLAEIREATP